MGRFAKKLIGPNRIVPNVWEITQRILGILGDDGVSRGKGCRTLVMELFHYLFFLLRFANGGGEFWCKTQFFGRKLGGGGGGGINFTFMSAKGRVGSIHIFKRFGLI